MQSWRGCDIQATADILALTTTSHRDWLSSHLLCLALRLLVEVLFISVLEAWLGVTTYGLLGSDGGTWSLHLHLLNLGLFLRRRHVDSDVVMLSVEGKSQKYNDESEVVCAK
jgi:hypothetical protein